MELTRRDIIKMGGTACLVAGALGAGTAMADEAASAGFVVGTADINFTQEG